MPAYPTNFGRGARSSPPLGVHMPDNVASVVEALRRYQSSNGPLGVFFSDCYQFFDWLDDTYFVGYVPPVALRLGKLRHQRMAEYSPEDGAMLPTITLDPTKSKDALEAAEWLAHEYIHHYLWTQGEMDWRQVEENHHSERFMNLCMDWGLSIDPGTGAHRGYVGDVWVELLADFRKATGVDLGRHTLPGPQTGRRLHKWACPAGDCEFSFRSRRTDLKVMCVGMGDDTHSPAYMGMVE